jgi:hypothetical protein
MIRTRSPSITSFKTRNTASKTLPIMAGVLLGKFNRTADDKISVPPDQLPGSDNEISDD